MTKRVKSASASSAPNGLKEVDHALPFIVDLIANTARWVHPEVFQALPVWRPEVARGQPLLKADWTTTQTNRGVQKYETNAAAKSSLHEALGFGSKRPRHFTTCHIWGYDDPNFMRKDSPVRDPRYFSCVGNMILLPTPLKGFTDAVPEIKRHLRFCAFHLYNWICEHDSMKEEADIVRSGKVPPHYPATWPTPERQVYPLGIGPSYDDVKDWVVRRKRKIAELLKVNPPGYPKSEVEKVISYWKMDLSF